ncbi:MAG: hypothetical protein CO093_11305 [Alphaproteobacteria bacterium CG_4_9_14_3_um_filter_47_13]|nr:MAG: hypothetical protein CO093_11305 [Alphaproteobacteria bacterium CG_4_9_14_3_um_filter_47_13]
MVGVRQAVFVVGAVACSIPQYPYSAVVVVEGFGGKQPPESAVLDFAPEHYEVLQRDTACFVDDYYDLSLVEQGSLAVYLPGKASAPLDRFVQPHQLPVSYELPRPQDFALYYPKHFRHFELYALQIAPYCLLACRQPKY